MLQLDEHVLYALSPFVYPKPKEIDPASLKPKSKIEIIQENDKFAITRRRSKLDENRKLLNKLNEKFHYDKYNEIKPILESNRARKRDFIQEKNCDSSLNDLINANISLISNNQGKDFNNKTIIEIDKKLEVSNLSPLNEKTFSDSNKQNISSISENTNNNKNNENRDENSRIHISEDHDLNMSCRKSIHNYGKLEAIISPKKIINQTKFFLTNITKSPKEKRITIISKEKNKENFTNSVSLKKAGRFIIDNKLNIKTDMVSPNSLKINLNNSPNQYFSNFYNTNTSQNKIDLNTKSTLNNNNNFTSTAKSRQSSIVNGRNTNGIKPAMLTTLSIKNNDNLTEARATKKMTFYHTRQSLNLKQNTPHEESLQNTHEGELLRKKSSNLRTSFNNNTGNRQISFKNQPDSLDIADLSIINPSPENELRMNLAGGSEKLRKMKSIENQNIQKDKRTLIFDKIYSYNSNFVKLIRQEQSKKCEDLQEYQNNLVQLIAEKTSMENLRQLSLKLKNVREIAESGSNVAKVNWKLFGKIMRDCREEMKYLRERIWVESEISKEVPIFQKELGLQKKRHVNLSKKFSKYESSLKRISPFIPEYLVEKFKNTLKIIN